jgi:hypothetical protein
MKAPASTGGRQMTVKFKIGFTITPEVIFGILSKVIPVEDLHIEQIVETRHRP